MTGLGTVHDVAAFLSAPQSASCLATNEWICGEYITTRRDELVEAVGQHLFLTITSLVIGVAVSFPLALLARRSPWAKGFVLGSSSVIYTIPSLALFAFLLPWTGISRTTVIIGLVLYTLTILVRAFVDGLEGVSSDVLEAARGMGYGSARLLWRIELPLSMPTFFAGLRVATVSTVALTTIGFVVGYGGLGNLIDDGLESFFKAQVLTATVLCVVIAVVLDLLVLGAQRILTPWSRRARST